MASPAAIRIGADDLAVGTLFGINAFSITILLVAIVVLTTYLVLLAAIWRSAA